MPDRWKPLAVAALLAASMSLSCGPAGGPRTPPNVILISIDCLNQRQFEKALGNGSIPHLARLVDEALVFTRAYAHSPWTTPSHMSMLTGLYPSQHGRDLPWGLMIRFPDHHDRTPDHPSLPTVLGAAGYETVAFVGEGSISGKFGFARGFERFEESSKTTQPSDLPKTVASFSAWVDGARPPFFLFLHTYDFHDPRPPGLEAERAALAYIDRQLGQVIEALIERDLYDSSLIIVTGDHGSEMIRTETKCCVHGAGHYEENLKVPLVVKLPGSGRTGRRTTLARHVDLYPTVMRLIQGNEDGYLGPGVSILDGSSGSLSFSEADGRCVRRFALVDDRYKYIYTPRGWEQWVLRTNTLFFDKFCPETCAALPAEEELFDLESDPFEETNLAATQAAAMEETLERFRHAMNRHLNLRPLYTRRVIVGGEASPLDRQLEEALRALGYVE